MAFYTSLRTLAGYLNSVRSNIFSMAVAIRGVWLIGDNLYAWFATIAAYLSLVVNGLYTAANDYLSFYNWVNSRLVPSLNLSSLVYYADDLISFIRDIGYNILQVIRQRLPNIYAFNIDPIAYILEILYKYTGLTYDFIHNPRSVINAIVNTAIGDLHNFILNPYGYIIQKITQGNPALYYLFYAPNVWLQIEINRLSPFLSAFLRDPSSFVLDTMINGLEALLDRYRSRLAKIAERILNAMF